MGKEIAGDPQHLDPGLALQLESQVCYFIQISVGLLKRWALRSHVPTEKKTTDITWNHGKPYTFDFNTSEKVQCVTFTEIENTYVQYVKSSMN